MKVLTLLWTYLIHAVDLSLYKQQSTIETLTSKLDTIADESTTVLRAKYEDQVTGLNGLIAARDDKIGQLNTRIDRLHSEIHSMKLKLADEA